MGESIIDTWERWAEGWGGVYRRRIIDTWERRAEGCLGKGVFREGLRGVYKGEKG